jgi:CheY-like chemotaxis protein
MADVLVVDDDADSCRALVRLFEKAGHDALCVFGGGEALSLLRALRFHLVLLDLRMPQIGGMEVLKAIRSSPRGVNTAVVIFSAEGNPTVQQEALAEGANDYVHKPVRWGQLYETVRPYLHNGGGMGRA